MTGGLRLLLFSLRDSFGEGLRIRSVSGIRAFGEFASCCKILRCIETRLVVLLADRQTLRAWSIHV